MRLRFSFVALACGAMLSAQPTLAADSVSPAKVASAAALVEKLDLEHTLDNMFEGLKGLFADNVVATMERDNAGGQASRLFSSVRGGRERFSQILGEEFLASLRKQYPEMKKVIAQEYAAAFSEDELRSLNDFFNTGAGEKWRKLTPQLEKSMGAWGERAGMKAGAEAVANAMGRIEAEQKDKGTKQ